MLFIVGGATPKLLEAFPADPRAAFIVGGVVVVTVEPVPYVIVVVELSPLVVTDGVPIAALVESPEFEAAGFSPGALPSVAPRAPW